jgi:hypothetical protein
VTVARATSLRRYFSAARSGSTGYSTEPRLHFVLFCNIDGTLCRTIPVRFRASDGSAATLKEGERIEKASSQSRQALRAASNSAIDLFAAAWDLLLQGRPVVRR